MPQVARTRPRVYFSRDGVELTNSEFNGLCLEGFGYPVGTIGKALCFQSLTVRTTIDKELTEADFGGPVTVKVWQPGAVPQYFGLASEESVRQAKKRKAVAA